MSDFEQKSKEQMHKGTNSQPWKEGDLEGASATGLGEPQEFCPGRLMKAIWCCYVSGRFRWREAGDAMVILYLGTVAEVVFEGRYVVSKLLASLHHLLPLLLIKLQYRWTPCSRSKLQYYPDTCWRSG